MQNLLPRRCLTTSINVHTHKLSRPLSAPKKVKKEREEWGSLIPNTLSEMDADVSGQLTATQLRTFGQAKLTLDEKKKLRRSLSHAGIASFEETLSAASAPLTRSIATVFQMNIGLYCNQACSHCHVESSPKRKEMMDRDVVNQCLKIIENSPSITTVDITGGAPELNAEFRYLVEGVSALEKTIIDRCNLTVLEEPNQEDLPTFLAHHRVRVVASLPCYSSTNVDTQRGRGVFERSVRGLQRLNELGYVCLFLIF